MSTNCRLQDLLLIRGPIFPTNGYMPPPSKPFIIGNEAQSHPLIANTNPSIYTAKRRYSCPKCPYSTDRRDLYTRHENIHRDEKPFRCYVCEKMFNRADHVKKHFLRIHKGFEYDVKLTKRIKGRDYDVKELSYKSNENQNRNLNENSKSFCLIPQQNANVVVSQSNCFTANPLLSELLYKRSYTNSFNDSKMTVNPISLSAQSKTFQYQLPLQNTLQFNNRINSEISSRIFDANNFKQTSNHNNNNNRSKKTIESIALKQTLKVQNTEENAIDDNQCEYCGCSFADFASLHTHRYLLHRYLLENNNYWPYRCVICGQRSVTQITMMQHMKSHTKSCKHSQNSNFYMNTFNKTALICQSSSSRRKQLQPRKIVKSIKDIEDYPIKTDNNFCSEKVTNQLKVKFNCKVCHKEFSTYTQFIQHQKFVKH